MGSDLADIKNEIKSRIEIVSFIERYVRLKKTGSNYMGLCPFHSDSKSPSLSIVPDKQYFHCFGCGKSGDIFTFLMEYEAIEFGGALKRLAEEAGVSLPGFSKDNSDEKEIIYEITEKANGYFASNIGLPPATDYLKSRKIDIEWAKDFQIGYAKGSWDGLMNFLLSRGYTKDVMLKAGLLSYSQDTNKYFDKFRDRIMLPFHSDSGKIAGFTGRGVTSEIIPKYLNSPETPIYHKSDVIFGFYRGRDHIRNENCVYLVEGNLDFISLFYRGIKNVVAISGTALSDVQAKKIKRLADTAILMLDNDEAGIKATLNSIVTLINNDVEVYCVLLPGKDDPDSFIVREGKECFIEYVQKNKTGFIGYEKKVYDAKYSSKWPMNVRVAFIKKIKSFIDQFTDNMKQVEYERELSFELNLSESEYKRISEAFEKDNLYQEKNKKWHNVKEIQEGSEGSSVIDVASQRVERENLAQVLIFLLRAPQFVEKFRDDSVFDDIGDNWKPFFDALYEYNQKYQPAELETNYVAEFLSQGEFSPIEQAIKMKIFYYLGTLKYKKTQEYQSVLAKIEHINSSNGASVDNEKFKDLKEKKENLDYQLNNTYSQLITAIRTKRRFFRIAPNRKY